MEWRYGVGFGAFECLSDRVSLGVVDLLVVTLFPLYFSFLVLFFFFSHFHL